MSNISVTQVYSVAPEALWAVVGAPGKISTWHPAIAMSSVEGSTRRCTLADGAMVLEEITSHDDGELRYSYRIVDSPLPVSDYTSTLRVQPNGDGARLTWESQFQVVGAPEADVENMIRGLYQAGLDSVAAHIRQ
jgi:hypothetical protein